MRKSIMQIVLLLIVLVITAEANVKNVNYKATFGIFGTVGTISNSVEKNKKSYTIKTTVKLAGIAKLIMGGQTEFYVSKGHVRNGLMISDFYSMTSTKKNEKKLVEYKINHKKKHVFKRYRKWVNGKLLKDVKKTLNFYAKDDLLTLYFNMNKAITKKGKRYQFKAVGLEKQKGIVNVTVPSKNKESSYKKDLGITSDWYAKARIVQKNFRKNEGDILLSVEKDGFIKKAVIKDVLMYGDAKLVRIK